jgi:hypothetical protein
MPKHPVLIVEPNYLLDLEVLFHLCLDPIT